MESRIINRIRRHLLSLAIFSHRKLCNKSYYKTSIVCWLYFPMESRLINPIRRHLLLLAIFTMESHAINLIKRYLLSLAIFYHGKSCNKSY